MNNGSGERTAKKEMAINDFSLLSEFGIIGHYIECELTHIFLFERKTSLFHHYFAVCSYEEFKEPDISIRDNKITEKLVEVNENFSLGIIQKRISFDESNYIFTQLCSGSFSLGTTTVLMPKNLQLLPKAHIPAYWDGIGVTLQNVLKPNFFGDTYIIEFLSLENPFLNILTALDFDKVNINVSKLIKLDLSSVNDRIGSFIFQFPITVIHAECAVVSDRCNAKLSIEVYSDSILPSDICTIVHTKLDDIITGFFMTEGIKENIEFKIGDSNNLEYIVFNKKNQLVYTHFLGNFLRKISIDGSFNVQYSEPRTIPCSDGKTIEVELFNHNLISVGYDNCIDDRIQNRIVFNEIIRQSGDFQVFNAGQRQEALDYIRRKLDLHSGNSSEIWLWDPYLRCRDIFDTLYYTGKTEISMRCITSYDKSKRLEELSGEETLDYETLKTKQKEEFLLSNNLGVNLEFRSTHDQIGTKFHDRFIIFMPVDTSKIPVVYSLGTSVNSLGLSHHVIQRTLDPRKITHSFQILWEDLIRDTDSLIIKLPLSR